MEFKLFAEIIYKYPKRDNCYYMTSILEEIKAYRQVGSYD